MPDPIRALVDEELSPAMTKELWSGDYSKALPVTLQDYELPALLPAMFYMFRFGERRGTGKFLARFADATGSPAQQRRSATVARVAEHLAASASFDGFEGDCEHAILADLLLCFCLENVRHAQGRNQQVQRIGAAHFMASWVDLPQRSAHLRYVPEMLVALLADQEDQEHVDITPEEMRRKTWFPVGIGYQDNVLLRPFSQGIRQRGAVSADRTSDYFDEAKAEVGLDQLLAIRLAEQMEQPPDPIPGKGASRISNQRPLAELASSNFAEDMRRFLRSYHDALPRRELLDMIEACIALGMTSVLLSVVDLLLKWSSDGRVREQGQQNTPHVFVDCSNGVDRPIQACAEQSMDDVMRAVARVPHILMLLRLLDYHAMRNARIDARPTNTHATAWLRLLGDLLYGRHEQAERVAYSVEEKLEGLANRLDEEADQSEVVALLRNEHAQPCPVHRLAQALTLLKGAPAVRKQLFSFVDSSLLIDRPNGLAVKRKTRRGGGRQRDVRSIVLTDPMIEYLVHLQLLKRANKQGYDRRLSFSEFLHRLRERYGLCIDTAPPGLSVSNEITQRNRATLERRLRDLGLLVGVNDAESMKRIRPRFAPG